MPVVLTNSKSVKISRVICVCDRHGDGQGKARSLRNRKPIYTTNQSS